MAAAANINAPVNAEGRTQLYVAAQDGNLAEVNRLLEAGADVNKVTNYELTPLFIASFIGKHLPVIERLLAAPGIDVNKARKDGTTPLLIAFEKRDIPVIERLLAAPGIDVNKARNNGETPLSIALPMLHMFPVPILVRLLDNNPGIDLNKTLRHDGETPLMAALHSGYKYIPIVERLLATPGIDVNKSMILDKYQMGNGTPLCAAVELGYLPIVERLLAAPGIDVNKTTSNVYANTPLSIAVYMKKIPIIKRLLAVPGIDVNKAIPVTKKTPLFMSLEYRYFDIAKLLLAFPGIDVNKSNEYGRTPLDIAENAEIIRLLEEKGARAGPGPAGAGAGAWNEEYWGAGPAGGTGAGPTGGAGAGPAGPAAGVGGRAAAAGILGISSNATSANIRKAYLRLALIHHPDKGGNAEQFKKIQGAYNKLMSKNGGSRKIKRSRTNKSRKLKRRL